MPNPAHPKTIRFLGRRLRLKDGANRTCAEWSGSGIRVEFVIGRKHEYLAEFAASTGLDFDVCICAMGRSLDEAETKLRRGMQRTLSVLTRAIKAVDRG